jgi:CopG family nickel-responsive transcriptional regulator
MSTRLLGRVDRLIETMGYTNPSEAVRDLIRDRLVDLRARAEDRSIVAALTLVCDHETRALGNLLTDIHHLTGHPVVPTLHVHLSHRDLLEAVVRKGLGGRFETWPAIATS